MGVKRPFDEEAIQELSFKQTKQQDGIYKPTSIQEDISLHEASEKVAISGDAKGLACEPDFGGELGDDKADKELETSAALSLVTSSNSEEEAGNGGPYFLPLYPDFFEFNIPRRPPIQFEDAYTYLFNSSPRKEVPIGPDHQADIPELDPNAVRKDSLSSNYITDDDSVQKWVGTSIILMPDSLISSSDDVKIGSGRADCDCLDKGSIRCVRQHVSEGRERLRENIGEEKFADLGFLDMGEEVAIRWTEEEERVFHEVIYSNPVSLGKNFWKHLSAGFPSRTKMELISYYFNVFILQRRAVQNRHDFLDIDSDDDEWQGDGRHTGVGEEEEDDSVVESFDDEDLKAEQNFGVSNDITENNEDETDADDDDSDDDDDDGDGNGDFGTNGADAPEKVEQREQLSPQPESKGDSGFDFRANNRGKVLSSYRDHDERHPFLMASSISAAEGAIIGPNGLKSELPDCPDGKDNGSSEGLRSGFVFEACGAKGWDDTYPTSHTRGIDLLPTCNMIEEIFGPCTWKSK